MACPATNSGHLPRRKITSKDFRFLNRFANVLALQATRKRHWSFVFVTQTFMDPQLLPLLVCPVTKGPLLWRPQQQELLSLSARLAYPVRDGIPVLLESEARPLSSAEYEAARTQHTPEQA